MSNFSNTIDFKIKTKTNLDSPIKIIIKKEKL